MLVIQQGDIWGLIGAEVAAATSVVRSARGPKLPTRCGNVTADVDMHGPRGKLGYCKQKSYAALGSAGVEAYWRCLGLLSNCLIDTGSIRLLRNERCGTPVYKHHRFGSECLWCFLPTPGPIFAPCFYDYLRLNLFSIGMCRSPEGPGHSMVLQ